MPDSPQQDRRPPDRCQPDRLQPDRLQPDRLQPDRLQPERLSRDRLRVGPRPTVFVGGPIQHALTAEGFDGAFRRHIEAVLAAFEAAGFTVLSAHRFEGFGALDTDGLHLEVTQRDFGWMQACDCFVALLPDGRDGAPLRSDGTCVELGWASALGKPVVLVFDGWERHSHLIRGLGAVATTRAVGFRASQEAPERIVAAAQALLGRQTAALAATAP